MVLSYNAFLFLEKKKFDTKGQLGNQCLGKPSNKMSLSLWKFVFDQRQIKQRNHGFIKKTITKQKF